MGSLDKASKDVGTGLVGAQELQMQVDETGKIVGVGLKRLAVVLRLPPALQPPKA